VLAHSWLGGDNIISSQPSTMWHMFPIPSLFFLFFFLKKIWNLSLIKEGYKTNHHIGVHKTPPTRWIPHLSQKTQTITNRNATNKKHSQSEWCLYDDIIIIFRGSRSHILCKKQWLGWSAQSTLPKEPTPTNQPLRINTEGTNNSTISSKD